MSHLIPMGLHGYDSRLCRAEVMPEAVVPPHAPSTPSRGAAALSLMLLRSLA